MSTPSRNTRRSIQHQHGGLSTQSSAVTATATTTLTTTTLPTTTTTTTTFVDANSNKKGKHNDHNDNNDGDGDGDAKDGERDGAVMEIDGGHASEATTGTRESATATSSITYGGGMGGNVRSRTAAVTGIGHGRGENAFTGDNSAAIAPQHVPTAEPAVPPPPPAATAAVTERTARIIHVTLDLDRKRRQSRMSSRRSEQRQRKEVQTLTCEQSDLRLRNTALRKENESFRDAIRLLRENGNAGGGRHTQVALDRPFDGGYATTAPGVGGMFQTSRQHQHSLQPPLPSPRFQVVNERVVTSPHPPVMNHHVPSRHQGGSRDVQQHPAQASTIAMSSTASPWTTTTSTTGTSSSSGATNSSHSSSAFQQFHTGMSERQQIPFSLPSVPGQQQTSSLPNVNDVQTHLFQTMLMMMMSSSAQGVPQPPPPVLPPQQQSQQQLLMSATLPLLQHGLVGVLSNLIQSLVVQELERMVSSPNFLQQAMQLVVALIQMTSASPQSPPAGAAATGVPQQHQHQHHQPVSQHVPYFPSNNIHSTALPSSQQSSGITGLLSILLGGGVQQQQQQQHQQQYHHHHQQQQHISIPTFSGITHPQTRTPPLVAPAAAAARGNAGIAHPSMTQPTVPADGGTNNNDSLMQIISKLQVIVQSMSANQSNAPTGNPATLNTSLPPAISTTAGFGSTMDRNKMRPSVMANPPSTAASASSVGTSSTNSVDSSTNTAIPTIQEPPHQGHHPSMEALAAAAASPMPGSTNNGVINGPTTGTIASLNDNWFAPSSDAVTAAPSGITNNSNTNSYTGEDRTYQLLQLLASLAPASNSSSSSAASALMLPVAVPENHSQFQLQREEEEQLQQQQHGGVHGSNPLSHPQQDGRREGRDGAAAAVVVDNTLNEYNSVTDREDESYSPHQQFYDGIARHRNHPAARRKSP